MNALESWLNASVTLTLSIFRPQLAHKPSRTLEHLILFYGLSNNLDFRV